MKNPILDFLYQYGFENQAKIYQKLIERKINIKLSEFVKILQNHPNVYLPFIYDNVIIYLPFFNFKKVINVLINFPQQNFDSVSYNQFVSKKWFVHNLNNLQLKYNSGIIAGGWHGILSLMLQNKSILTTDIDPDAIKIAKIFGCNAEVANAFDIDYKAYDIIINTSCEHWNFDKWMSQIPMGKIIALQSTNMIHKDHIDNIYSSIEFINRANLSKVYTINERKFDQYTRYLLIGRK